jgi:ABC-type nitrate/sulfonate/bicarbonate transport system permease component
MVAAMARVEDQVTLAAAETDLTQVASRRLDMLFRGGAGIFSILIFLLAWELFARSGKVTMFMLPPFTVVAEYIWKDATSLEPVSLTIFGHTLTMKLATLWINLGLTLYRAMTGFFIAAIGGITLATLMSRVRIVRWFFDPIISVGFPMPKIAFLPVIILWLGLYDFAKISIVVFDAIFPVVTATLAGIAAVEKELVWSARNMGANERRLMWQIVLPAASPQILTGLQVALPIALIVEIIAEMVMGGYGLGGAMMGASRFANSPGVFAGIVEIAIVGFILIKAMAMLRRRLLVWHQEAAEPTGA